MKCEECLHYEMCKSLEECNGIRMIKADNCSFGLGEVDEEEVKEHVVQLYYPFKL